MALYRASPNGKENMSYIDTGNRGGYSNTPLTTPRCDKQVVIDWLSYTFDNITYDGFYDRKSRRYIYSSIEDTIDNSKIMTMLFKMFRCNEEWSFYEYAPTSMNGYQFSFIIGEHIRINFGGAKTKADRPSTQILLSGQACRELEERGGDWEEVLIGLNSLDGNYKRIDIAIDDFKGDKLNIYDLESYAKKGSFVASYQTLQIIESISYRGGIFSKGYSLTFGSTG